MRSKQRCPLLRHLLEAGYVVLRNSMGSLAFAVPPGPIGLPGFPAYVLVTTVLNGEPLALTEPPGPGPTLPVLHDMPWIEPGCQ
jgi:hypothetical protein